MLPSPSLRTRIPSRVKVLPRRPDNQRLLLFQLLNLGCEVVISGHVVWRGDVV